MIDITNTFKTLKYAIAEGRINVGKETLDRVKNRDFSQGDILEVAKAAGMMAAKKTSDTIFYSHPLPLDWIEVKTDIENNHIRVCAEVKSVRKTGVEMEALTAVTTALLNIYDILNPFDDNLRIDNVSVLKKRGGKSSYTDTFKNPLKTALLVISDSTHAGERKDKSGKVIGG